MNSSTAGQLDRYFRSFLDIAGYDGADISQNGLQVANDGGPISKIAFAVDASLETFRRAAGAGAQMLFVHHGLFWGKPLRIVGSHRARVKFLLDNNIALYAAHLPLDQHPVLGNNIAVAELLGIQDPQPFSTWRGRAVGYCGRLATPLTVDEALQRITFEGRPPLGVYPFGKERSETAAVITGGGGSETTDAIAQGLDLYVTGVIQHEDYNPALEAKINVIAGGHYNTEVWGVRRVMEKTAAELQIDVEFIDVPTGL
jgi:dinuclear metal center YbgI/SA1388 family protein